MARSRTTRRNEAAGMSRGKIHCVFMSQARHSALRSGVFHVLESFALTSRVCMLAESANRQFRAEPRSKEPLACIS